MADAYEPINQSAECVSYSLVSLAHAKDMNSEELKLNNLIKVKPCKLALPDSKIEFKNVCNRTCNHKINKVSCFMRSL